MKSSWEDFYCGKNINRSKSLQSFYPKMYIYGADETMLENIASQFDNCQVEPRKAVVQVENNEPWMRSRRSKSSMIKTNARPASSSSFQTTSEEQGAVSSKKYNYTNWKKPNQSNLLIWKGTHSVSKNITINR